MWWENTMEPTKSLSPFEICAIKKLSSQFFSIFLFSKPDVRKKTRKEEKATTRTAAGVYNLEEARVSLPLVPVA